MSSANLWGKGQFLFEKRNRSWYCFRIFLKRYKKPKRVKIFSRNIYKMDYENRAEIDRGFSKHDSSKV